MRVKELVEKIKKADKAYYTDGSSDLSDTEYDLLKEELRSLDPDNQVLQSLGDDHSAGIATVKRKKKMLSLAKIQQDKENPDNLSEILRWVSSRGYSLDSIIVEPKVDGMSAELKYERGVLTCISTRGAGDEGDDITANTKHIFPANIPDWAAVDEVNVRGELYISKDEYARINAAQEEAGEPIFANARNLCAGTVKSKEPVTDRSISFVAHGFGYVSEGFSMTTFKDWYTKLESYGIPVVPNCIVGCETRLCVLLQTYRNDTSLPYWLDGAVIKANSIREYIEAGETEHHPKGAVAFKFIPEAKYTTVKKIIWQIGGKTGKAVPVAVVEPTLLAGSTVERVTLSNAGLMAARGIKVGSKVLIEKANEIIPHIVSVVDAEAYTLPPTETCPCCGSTMELKQGKLAPTADYICPNEACIARKAAAFQSALGSKGINVMGIGPEICTAFVTQYPNINAATLVQMTPEEYPDILSPLQKDNLYKEVRKARSASLWRWISAMMIPGIGEGSAKAMSKACKNLRAWIAELNTGVVIPRDVTAARWEACKEYINSPNNMANELISMSMNPESDNYIGTIADTPIKDLSFVVTGSFAYGRKAIEDMIPKMGGILKSSVSKKVDYVVCGDDPGVTKINKASQLEIPIITADELFAMIQ